MTAGIAPFCTRGVSAANHSKSLFHPLNRDADSMTRSENMRRLWADPEWRAKRVAAASLKASETQTRFWNDPTSRPARLAQLAAARRAYRAKVLAKYVTQVARETGIS